MSDRDRPPWGPRRDRAGGDFDAERSGAFGGSSRGLGGKSPLTSALGAGARPTGVQLVADAQLYLTSAEESAFEQLEAAAASRDRDAAARAWSHLHGYLAIVEQSLKDAEGMAVGDDAEADLIRDDAQATRGHAAHVRAEGLALVREVDPALARESAREHVPVGPGYGRPVPPLSQMENDSDRGSEDGRDGMVPAAAMDQATTGPATEVPHRSEMERAFGEDFGGVRAHVGQAAPMASMNAEAAARGDEIAFASSSPSAPVVAHELAHVAQYRRAGRGAAPVAALGTESGENPAEREAEAVARHVAERGLGDPLPPITAAPEAPIHRSPPGGEQGAAQPNNEQYDTVVVGLRNVPESYAGRELRIYVLMRMGGRTWAEADAALRSTELAWFETIGLSQDGTFVTLHVTLRQHRLLEGKPDASAGEKSPGESERKKNGKRDPADDNKVAVALSIPPHLTTILGEDVSRYDQAQLARVVGKLKHLTLDEVQLFKHLATHLTQDLALFERAVDEFLRFRTAYKAALDEAATRKPEKSLQDKLDDKWTGFDYEKQQALPRAERLAKARELAAEQRNERLKHMVSHPGETITGMAKGLNPIDVGEEVWKDVQDAVNGGKGGYARWAAGVGGVTKISGWLAGTAGVLYIGLLFVPGVNIAQLAATALIAGAAAVALSAAESELHVQAAANAKGEEEFKHEVDRSGEAQTNAIAGGVMMASGFVFRIAGKIRLPGRLQNVNKALSSAGRLLADKTGLSRARASLLDALRRERAGLPEELARELAEHTKAAALLDKLTPEQFLSRLAKGDKRLQELTEITPDQAATLEQLNRTPGAEGTARTLLDQYRRALRDAPGTAHARVSRIVETLDDAIRRVEAATSPEELRGAINDASSKLDQRALTEQDLAERQAMIKERVDEALLEEPVPPRASPNAAPPAGMSPKLIAVRGSLTDPRAIERFDSMFDGMKNNSARMESAIDNMSKAGGSLEEKLIDQWNKDHPVPKKPSGPELSQVPELVVEGETLLVDIESFRAANPDVKGIGELVKRTKAEIEILDEVRTGSRVADAITVGGVRNNLNGVRAELNSAFRNSGVTRLSWKPKSGGKEAEVDVVADRENTWIDVKETEPFTTESNSWTGKEGKKGLRLQATQMVEVAKQKPIRGTPPQVVYEFTKGVTASVARALEQIGRDAGVIVKVRGTVLEDARLVLPPGRDPNQDQSEP